MTEAVLKNQVTKLSPESGLKLEGRQLVADALSGAVANTYRLMINTQGLHWNVQGPLFYSIHKLTEEQYQDMFAAVDALAERMRALGFPAPHNVSELMSGDAGREAEKSDELQVQIEALIEGNEHLAHMMRQIVAHAERNEDVKTADLLTERIGIHEENAWMLRATIAS